MNRQLPVLLLAVLGAACASKSAPEAKADPPYVFPHTPHVENDVDCLLCHAAIQKATKLEARVRHVGLPRDGKACSDCHDATPKLDIPARTRDFDVRFDHAAHLPRVNGNCKACHTSLPDPKETVAKKPAMDACTACHNHQRDFAQGSCAGCHVDLKRYDKPVASFQHEGEFLKLHGARAAVSAESCASCHEQTFCADCHSATTVPMRQAIRFPEEVQKDFIHRGDFVSRHMVEADANPASCRRCHGSRFCDTCHTAQNLTQRSEISPRNPHPPGWGTDKAGGNFHGDAARRNIITCAGCHDHGTDAICTQCHQVGGFAGVNIHPQSFLSKHRTTDRTTLAVCMACHPN
jgi:hypothetical protein